MVTEVLCPESVTLVSAHSRAGKHGGFTSYYNEGTASPLYWKQSRIIGSLGGMAAIEQKFGLFDTGNSLSFVYDHLMAKEPASLKICTLLDKPSRRKPGVTLQADYVGFTIPNAFVVGYGLDYDEYYRNLPYIGVLKPEAYT